MAITVKNNAVTLKTVKGKSGQPEAAQPVAPQLAPAAAPLPQGAHPVSGPSYTPFMIMGLIGIFFLIAILVIQFLEWQHYHAVPPSAFP